MCFVMSLRLFSQVTNGAMEPHLSVLVPALLEILEGPDWVARKAGAQSLGRLVACMDPHALALYKPVTVMALEKCRSDKVQLYFRFWLSWIASWQW